MKNHQFQGPDTAMIYLAISTSECATVALAWFFDSSGIMWNLLRFASAICLTFQMYVATVVLFGTFHCTFHGTCCFCHRWSWQATSANIFNTPPTQTAAAVILGQVVHSVHICHTLSKTWLHDNSMFRISSESFQVFLSCLYIFVTMICPFSRWFSPGLFVASLENPRKMICPMQMLPGDTGTTTRYQEAIDSTDSMKWT